MAKKHQGDLHILRNIRAQSVTVDRIDIPTSASDLQLNFASEANMFFTGSTAGQIVTFGDTTDRYMTGHEYRIHNGSSEDITVRDYGLNVLEVVRPQATIIAYLQENSTPAGIWFIGRPNITSAPAIIIPNFICEYSAALLDLVVHDKVVDTKVLVISSNSTAEMPQGLFGMIVGKPTPTLCNVLIRGLVPLVFSGLVKGEAYYVGTNGLLTTSIPATGMVQKVGTASSATKFIYDPTGPYRRSIG